MRYIIPLVLLLLISCNQDSVLIVDVPLNQEFTLKIGEEVSVDNGNLIVRFVNVVADSRCPMNARCFWAGNGEIVLELRKPNSAAAVRHLNTFLEPQATDFDTYEVQLKMLTPIPVLGEEIKPGDYRATLLVEQQ